MGVWGKVRICGGGGLDDRPLCRVGLWVAQSPESGESRFAVGIAETNLPPLN